MADKYPLPGFRNYGHQRAISMIDQRKLKIFRYAVHNKDWIVDNMSRWSSTNKISNLPIDCSSPSQKKPRHNQIGNKICRCKKCFPQWVEDKTYEKWPKKKKKTECSKKIRHLRQETSSRKAMYAKLSLLLTKLKCSKNWKKIRTCYVASSLKYNCIQSLRVKFVCII